MCGQVKSPARSARAQASASSCSLACSTTPSSAASARSARSAETGAPIWMAEARVFWAAMGFTSTPGPGRTPAAVVARKSGLACSAWATTSRGSRSMSPSAFIS